MLSFENQSPVTENVSKIKLSGRVLCVVTQLPYQIVKSYDKEKQNYTLSLDSVQDNSLIYSSFTYLTKTQKWDTHLIGWTGETVVKVNNKRIVLDDESNYGLNELSENDQINIEKDIKNKLMTNNVHSIFLLNKNQHQWKNYADKFILPVLFYVEKQFDFFYNGTEAWHAYVKFNEYYFQKIKSIYKKGDIIWIHNHHLLLLPQLLRMEYPDVIIIFYFHNPFPSSEFFRTLSKRNQLLDGILGSNVIGFQSDSFKNHFLSCSSGLFKCKVKSDLISVYGSKIRVITLPIGIDTQKIEDLVFSPDSKIALKVQSLKNTYLNKKIIIGRDRLDQTHGLLQKLEAFKLFLQLYPEWRDNVVLIQILNNDYFEQKFKKKVADLINEINSTYGSLSSTPILHYQMNLEKEDYLSLLTVADLALTTSLRDGMNTTSLEFVICQKQNNSPLIMSEFTGTASFLNDGIMVNPWDFLQSAKTINECLLMSDVMKKEIQGKLYKKVVSNNIQNWTNKFLNESIKHVSCYSNNYTPALDRPLLLSNYKKAKKRLFLFDYDGTLTPIVSDPESAVPSSRLDRILDSLTSDPKNIIWIISGRDQVFLNKWFGNKKCNLSAEHGSFIKEYDSNDYINLTQSFDMSWLAPAQKIFSDYVALTPGSFIEEKKACLTFHYRKADPLLGSKNAALCLETLKKAFKNNNHVEILLGKSNIETRSKSVNKGEIVKRIIYNNINSDDLQVNEKDFPDFFLCLGDDTTDEDMFKSLSEIEVDFDSYQKKKKIGDFSIFTVFVGPPSNTTAASYHLNNTTEVLDTLDLLIGNISLFESPGSVFLDSKGQMC